MESSFQANMSCKSFYYYCTYYTSKYVSNEEYKYLNSHNEQIPKLYLQYHFDQHFMKILMDWMTTALDSVLTFVKIIQLSY